MKKILFIDRDGTLVEEPYDYQVDELSKIRLMPHVIPSLLSLTQEGFSLVMVSNQDGLGTARFPQTSFQKCHDFILELFASQGIFFEEIFICPHLPNGGCSCRKPKTGLLDAFLENNKMDFKYSYVIGDRDTDRLLAENLGLTFLPISHDHNWKEITQTILQSKRSVSITRKTNETDITVTLVLDCDELSSINTPIGFFTHMLEQIAKHAGIYLDLQAKGDVEVDEHHLIEDTAITLGEALKKALGDKAGIQRYGFTVPMDESLATVAIDIGGRGSSHFEGHFTRNFVGGLATEMISHFFHSFATSLGATIHVQVKGTNNHHMIEACFKALGRALRQATTKHGTTLPSTKGVL
ncbi:MAG: bifunctional histidinol-phosphatase/imidazoleglycerol-phosphate dehydratase HisB [Chthoniobacterales bacterium]